MNEEELNKEHELAIVYCKGYDSGYTNSSRIDLNNYSFENKRAWVIGYYDGLEEFIRENKNEVT